MKTPTEEDEHPAVANPSTSFANQVDESNWSEFCDESVLKLLDEPFSDDLNYSHLRNDENYRGFDNNAGTNWIYPNNYPIRQYQFNITKSALFRNTLVVLPTGLGKTFIAAVVMYNIYRWYPTGKIIFMAPTKPLVSQQIEACRKIVGIPAKDTSEITGKQNKSLRRELWRNKRVFFATPQVIQNDVQGDDQDFPFNDIRLVVVDEAHKAKGRYAHAEAVRLMAAKTSNFRVLALSATPGRSVEDVIEVIKNLFISHLEIRWENSLDVVSYTFRKNIKTVIIPLGTDLTQIRDEFIDIIDPFVRYLIDNQVLSGSLNSLSRGSIIMEQKRFKDLSMTHKHPNESQVKTNFSICVSLYHALELLERHGIRVFLNFFDDPSNAAANRYYVSTNPQLRQFLEKLRKYIGPNPFLVNDQTMTNGKIPEIPDDLDFGHPKFDMVKQRVIEHFQLHEDSRVIIFCEYRESVLLMFRALLQSRPLVKPKVFVGQGGTGSIRAVTQKQQMEVMEQFRSGACNTLVATSVAEEGMDIGEVDLIICFDINTRNPTRFIQRIGRTGRRRQGNIIMMATEGKEQAIMKEVLHSKDKLNQKVVKSTEVMRALYKKSPRIVPPEFNPKCMEMFMTTNEEEDPDKKKAGRKTKVSKESKQNKKKSKESNPSQNVASSQKTDVRNYFRRIELDKEDKEVFCIEKPNTSCKSLSILETTHTSNKIDSIIHKIERLKKEPVVEEAISMKEIMRSVKLSNAVKKIALKLNMDYLEEKVESQRALNAVADQDLYVLRDEEVQLKLELSAIEGVVGKGMIEKFIEENKIEDPKVQAPEEDFSYIFAGLEKRSFVDDVEDFIDRRIKEIEAKESEISKNLISNQPFSPTCELSHIQPFEDEYEDIFLNHESRYVSQLVEIDKHKIADQSTPLRKMPHSKVNNEEMQAKTLFPGDELGDDFDPIIKCKENDEINNIPIVDNETELNMFDDDFDEFFVNSEFETEIVNIEQNNTKPKSNNSSVIDKTIEKDTSCDSEEIPPSPKNSSHKNSSRLGIEDFDYTQFFEPFDCEDFATIDEVIKPHDERPEDLNKNIITTPSTSVCNDSVLSRKKSDELFASNERTLPALNPYQDEKQHKLDSPPASVSKQPETSPSVLNKAMNLKRLRLTAIRGSFSCNSSMLLNNTNTSLTNGFSKNSATSGLESEIDSPITMPRKTKRVIESDSEVEELPNSQAENMPNLANKNIAQRRKIKRRRCEFIDDEAAVSNDDDDGEPNVENSEFSQMHYDSVVCMDDDVDDHPDVDMRAKYLQSVKSPQKKGAFRIPAPRVYNDMSRIFSQVVPFEPDSVYKEDSFVISSDEEVAEEPMTQECPLERAEAILKARRREKRMNKNNGVTKCRKAGRIVKLNRIIELSSDEDSI